MVIFMCCESDERSELLETVVELAAQRRKVLKPPHLDFRNRKLGAAGEVAELGPRHAGIAYLGDGRVAREAVYA